MGYITEPDAPLAELPGFVIPITRPLDQVEDFENLWRVWKIGPSYQ
jgi:hypothetical protein